MFTGLGATGMRRQASGMRPPLRVSDRRPRRIDRSLSLQPAVFWLFSFFPFFSCTQLDRRRCSDDDRYRRSTLISCFIRVVCSDVNPNWNGMNERLPRSIPRTLTQRSYKDRDADVTLRARVISLHIRKQ